MITIKLPVRQQKTEVHWYYGPTGTGKSREAYRIAEAASSYYVKDPTNKWWDGYDQQDVVIIDDYRRDFATFATLLRLFDRYAMSVEYKGGTVQFNSRMIIVTSPKDPKSTWEGRSDEDIQQLMRRIDFKLHFDVFPAVAQAAAVSPPAMTILAAPVPLRDCLGNLISTCVNEKSPELDVLSEVSESSVDLDPEPLRNSQAWYDWLDRIEEREYEHFQCSRPKEELEREARYRERVAALKAKGWIAWSTRSEYI